MISSGDSGSGYASDDGTCQQPEGGASKGIGIDGAIASTQVAQEIGQCCEMAQQAKAKGWSFVPHAAQAEAEAEAAPAAVDDDAVDMADVVDTAPGKGPTIKFDKAEYHVAGVEPGAKGVFTSRQIYILTGSVVAKTGGTVKAKNLNTSITTVLTFAPGKSPPAHKGQYPRMMHMSPCCA